MSKTKLLVPPSYTHTEQRPHLSKWQPSLWLPRLSTRKSVTLDFSLSFIVHMENPTGSICGINPESEPLTIFISTPWSRLWSSLTWIITIASKFLWAPPLASVIWSILQMGTEWSVYVKIPSSQSSVHSLLMVSISLWIKATGPPWPDSLLLHWPAPPHSSFQHHWHPLYSLDTPSPGSLPYFGYPSPLLGIPSSLACFIVLCNI